MNYRGYRILANEQISKFYEIDNEGNPGKEVAGVLAEADDLWYSVVDKDNVVVTTEQSVGRCKDYIEGEVEDMDNILVVPELGCAYRWSNYYNVLEYCPLTKDNVLMGTEWGPVEEDLVGDEVVNYKGKEVTFSEVYRDVEKILLGGK